MTPPGGSGIRNLNRLMGRMGGWMLIEHREELVRLALGFIQKPTSEGIGFKIVTMKRNSAISKKLVKPVLGFL